MDLSFIVPCYNEELCLEAFHTAATEAFASAGITSYELLFIDDGSSDGTLRVIKGLAARDPHISFVSFSRNFGKESAIFAGLEHASGDTLCIIDADLQQLPSTALDMYRYLLDHPEYDVVAAYQQERHENRFMRFCKRRFYRMFNHSGEMEIPLDMSDFRVFRRSVAVALQSLPETMRFSKGLFAWVGFNTYAYPYVASERTAGSSKWSFRKLMAYALDGIISFSTMPLRFAIYIGVLMALIALVYLIYNLIEVLVRGIITPGFPTLICVVLLLGGLILSVLGIIGEYIARIYLEGKHRPIYLARETHLAAPDEPVVRQALQK